MLGNVKLFTYVNDSGVNFHIILRFTLIVRDCRQPAGKLVAEVVDTGENCTTCVCRRRRNSTMTKNSSLPTPDIEHTVKVTKLLLNIFSHSYSVTLTNLDTGVGQP